MIEPFDLERLPHVRARDAALGRTAAWALAALPSGAEVTLPGFGAVVVRYGGLADSRDVSAEDVSFGLVRPRGAGRICVPAALARSLVAATLGAVEAPSLRRRLGMGERGLLGGLIAAVLHELGTDLSLSLESPPATDGAFRLAIAASTPAGSGELVLEVPPAWLRRATDENRWRRRAAEHLSVVAELRLARTAVPRGMLATVEEGDAVIFDGHESLAGRAQAPWPVALTLGDHQALGVCSADGTITVEGPFRRFRPPSARQLGRDKESTMEPPVSSIDGAAVLAAAPVEVIAELGRLTLRGEEVLALAPGVVIALEAPRPTVISLRVGGEIWAEGELVNVDGELGVRVTSLRRPLTPAER